MRDRLEKNNQYLSTKDSGAVFKIIKHLET